MLFFPLLPLLSLYVILPSPTIICVSQLALRFQEAAGLSFSHSLSKHFLVLIKGRVWASLQLLQ